MQEKKWHQPPYRCSAHDLDPNGSGGAVHGTLGFPLYADLHTGFRYHDPGSLKWAKANICALLSYTAERCRGEF